MSVSAGLLRRAPVWALAVLAACGDPGDPCGPGEARVARVVDGDTVVLEGGERVRYLLADTPELGPPPACGGAEARAENAALVAGRRLRLTYPGDCRDRFGRLLAWPQVGDAVEVVALLVARGRARALVLPQAAPQDPDRFRALAAHVRALEARARAEGRGLWTACATGGASP